MRPVRSSATLRRVGIVSLCVSSLAAACSFPDVAFVGDSSVGDGTTGSDAPLDSASGEGSVGFDTGGGDEGVTGTDAPGGDGREVADVGADAGPGDAADAGAPLDSGQDASGVPDAADTGTPKDSGGVTDGPNCDCAASSMFKTGISCAGLLGIGCTGTQGFMSTPSCGQTADFFMCTGGVLSCTTVDNGPRVQQCQ
ncbi:MAG: hypothetical protein ACLP1X_27620 [Polyangiaceae bacterium]